MISVQRPAGSLYVAHSALCQRHPRGSGLPPQGRICPCWPEATQHSLECWWRVLQTHRLWPQLQRRKPGVCWVCGWSLSTVSNVSSVILPPPGCQVHSDRWLSSPRGRASEQSGSSWSGGGGGLWLHSGGWPVEFGYHPAGDILGNQTQRHCSLERVEGRKNTFLLQNWDKDASTNKM